MNTNKEMSKEQNAMMQNLADSITGVKNQLSSLKQALKAEKEDNKFFRKTLNSIEKLQKDGDFTNFMDYLKKRKDVAIENSIYANLGSSDDIDKAKSQSEFIIGSVGFIELTIKTMPSTFKSSSIKIEELEKSITQYENRLQDLLEQQKSDLELIKG